MSAEDIPTGLSTTAATTARVAFGGGCFWCTEAVYRQLRGIRHIEVGYCNGHAQRPSYEQVCTGDTGCVEVVHLDYDPGDIDFLTLLEVFFASHDPTTPNRQGHDVGTQYRSGIYTTTPEQAATAQALIRDWNQRQVFAAPIVTEVQALRHYWPAEAEHQDFWRRHPWQGYCRVVATPKVDHIRRRFDHLCQTP